MKHMIISLILLLLFGLSGFADQVVLASEEDLEVFDQMLAPPVVQIEVQTTEGTELTEVPTELVQQRGGFSLIVSDDARQNQPQRGVVPNPVLRGLKKQVDK